MHRDPVLCAPIAAGKLPPSWALGVGGVSQWGHNDPRCSGGKLQQWRRRLAAVGTGVLCCAVLWLKGASQCMIHVWAMCRDYDTCRTHARVSPEHCCEVTYSLPACTVFKGDI
jgi:hypothetical protein